MKKIEISETVAICLQRMIVDEIDKQKQWMAEEEKEGRPNPTRPHIIKELRKISDQLEDEGIHKYRKCC